MSSDDVPKPLTKLIQIVMRGFYNLEQKLIIDMLVRRRETKEEDLVESLKLEKKHLRSLIQQMKQDKFINVRLIMETDGDNKSTRRSYYSINYRMFVNVVKYKIDHMRRKLETEERDLTSRASFICKSCCKTFTDLEIGQIYDPSRDQCRCTYCDGIVDEDPNIRPVTDSRLIMANFNQQMEPIYALLQETEHLGWSINRADRNNLTAKNSNFVTSNGVSSTSNATANQSSANLTMNVSHQDSYLITIDGIDPDGRSVRSMERREPKDVAINPEVEALLLREESSTVTSEGPEDILAAESCAIMVNVGKFKMPINEVNEHHIELMTPQQKDDYQKLMQQLYNFLYE